MAALGLGLPSLLLPDCIASGALPMTWALGEMLNLESLFTQLWQWRCGGCG